MAITTTGIGPNSAKIDYDAGTALASLISAVDTYITSAGWSLYDGSAGTNAKAYRALNKDGSTYKYIVLDYNTSNRLICKVYESWNSVAHTGSNLAYYSDQAGLGQQVDLTNGGSLYLYSYTAWLILFSKIGATLGSATGASWCGCLEVARDNPEDTAGAAYPCWGWANGYELQGSGQHTAFSYPRLRDGTTGSSCQAFVSTLFSVHGHVLGSFNVNFTYWSTNNNSWNSKNWSFTVRTGKYGAINNACFINGRIFGIKLTQKSLGSFLDDIYCNCDADFFYDPAGGSTQHWVLPETGGGRTIIPA